MKDRQILIDLAEHIEERVSDIGNDITNNLKEINETVDISNTKLMELKNNNSKYEAEQNAFREIISFISERIEL